MAKSNTCRFSAIREGLTDFGNTITKGQIVPPHQHKDSWAILVSGKLAYTLGPEQFIRTPGQSWFIPDNTLHGGKALDNSLLVEVFCEERWSTG